MAFAETTNPDVSPWGSTVLDASAIRARAARVTGSLAKRARRVYEPAWEDPGLHGRGREVSLRGREDIGTITGQWQRKALRLPPVPRKSVGTGEAVLLVGLVVGAGALAWWLWRRNKAKTSVPSSAVGEDCCGLDMLGAD